MDHHNTTRRAFLKGLPAASAALVSLPAAATPAFDLQGWLDTVSPHDVALYHAGHLASAMGRLRDGSWYATVNVEQGFALVARHPEQRR